MPGSTPDLNYPYPLGDDPVRDGDDIIRALAERIEYLTNSVRIRSGTVVMTVTTNNTIVGAAIVYPANSFLNAPAVVVALNDTASPQNKAVSTTSGVAAGFTIRLNQISGPTPGDTRISWVAMGRPGD
jgi:hypothetical protein